MVKESEDTVPNHSDSDELHIESFGTPCMNNDASKRSSVDVSNDMTMKKSEYLGDRITLNVDDPVRNSYKDQTSIHSGKLML